MMSHLLTTRNVMWGLALGVTVWLSLNAPAPRKVVQAKRGASQQITETKQTVATSTANQFTLLARTDDIEQLADIFAINKKMVVKPTQIKKHKIKKQTPPPFPFEYLGSMIEDNQERLFMILGEQMVTIKVGDKIDGRYKLIEIQKMDGKSRLKFLYLPMKLTQTMVVNNAN